ncbi:MAG: 5-oxoprolinase subunit PxpB [Thermoanaerobaculia bacterium]|nr:5-oxoprolinase subunit PxpB [Thermoanaerobaculia bacterium]
MPCRIAPLGDRGLLIDWGNRIDEALNRQVLSLWDRLRRASPPGVSDLVPAYSSLTLIFNAPDARHGVPAATAYDTLRRQVEHLLANPPETEETTGRQIRIPVCYDQTMAPDLPALAARCGLPADKVVELHTGREYRVFMLGFLPGFPYMGTVDEQIATPRLSEPRSRVPAGSVGIAGAQTGIYPLESPGGWNLIGRTPLRLFDAQRAEPTLLQPGDRVRFFPISPREFHQIQAGS